MNINKFIIILDTEFRDTYSRSERKETEEIIFKSFDDPEKDKFALKLQEAINTIEKNLRPFLKL